MSSYPFKNLIFKGGGARGMAYLGAAEVLFKEGIIQQATRVAGSSAGAITALVVALNEDFDTTIKIANSLDFSKIAGIPSFFATRDVNDPEYYEEEAVPRGLLNTFSNVGTSVSQAKFLFSTLGLHTSEYIYNWLDDQVARVTGNYGSSFKEFVEKGGKDLYITVTNISNQSSHICSAETTPDLEVAEAVRTSLSIPIFFESIIFENIYFKGYFGDGGVMNNYPINLFDEGLEPNEETLGLFLYTKDNTQKLPEHYGLKDFAGDMVFSLLQAQDWYVARQQEDVARTIQIECTGVSPTGFDIQPGDAKYKKLYDSGKAGAEAFIEAYNKKDIKTLTDPLWIAKGGGRE